MPATSKNSTECATKIKSQKWTFSLLNYTDDDLARIAKPYDEVQYIAYGKEVCPTTKTPHLQGFLYMWNPCRMTALKKYLPRAHLEAMHGRWQDNVDYCSKEAQLTEHGQRPMQGRRTDLIGAKRRLDEGTTHMELAQEEPFFGVVAKHHRFFHKYEQYKRAKTVQEDRDVPNVYVRIGPPGTGKTRWMDEKFGRSGWIMAPDNTGRWFDGCDRDAILFDDVQVGEVPSLGQFKKLTDRYPQQVPVKGDFIWWKPKNIVFTSNSHPNEWWPDLTEFDKGAIERRITEIVVVEGPNEEE